MLLLVDRFGGIRPRIKPRLLNRFEAQVADNARLWSGSLASWRRPSQVQAVGTNSLRWSNSFENGVWAQLGLAGVTANASTGPDGSLTMEKLRESAVTSQHGVQQNVAKVAEAQWWTFSVSVKAAERGFALIYVGDSGANYARGILNIATGAITTTSTAGTYTGALFSQANEGSGIRRVSIIVKTGPESVVYGGVYAALDATTFSYLGTLDSGIYAYGASLRKAKKVGFYRETYAAALPSIGSIYRYNSLYWFVTSQRADFTKGPIPDDAVNAIYFTGGPADRPSFTYDPIAYSGNNGRGDMPRQFYTLGLPAPASALTAATSPQTGAVSAVSSQIATLATQTGASFSLGGVTTDGYQIRLRGHFNVQLSTTQSQGASVKATIKRGTIVIAEIERKTYFAYGAGETGTQTLDFTLEGNDTPAAGTYSYDYAITVTAVDGKPITPTYSTTEIKAYYTKTRIQVGAGHPFAQDDYITVSGVIGFEAVNKSDMVVVATEANAVWVDVTSQETYSSGGTWKRSYPEDSKFDTGYVVTFITQVGTQTQEGPPSPVSNAIAIGKGEPVSLTGIPTTVPADGGTYNVTGKRIYRANADSGGNAIYQFVAEIPLSQATYTDTTKPSLLGEEIPSIGWIKPPQDMTGLTEIYGGMLAGISKNLVCFCYPYQPHAWPTKYQIPVNYTPLALGVYGEAVLVATSGKPTAIVGATADNLRPVPLELTQPLASLTSFVDMGDYIVYAGDDGLVFCSTGRKGVITEGMYTREGWEELNPSSIVAAEYDGCYVGFYTPEVGDPAGFVLDPRSEQSTFAPLDWHADCAWTDPASGDLYLVIDETICKFDADPNSRFTYRWQSKEHVMPRPVCPAYAHVIAENYPIDFVLHANKDARNRGVMHEIMTKTVMSSEPFALRGDYLADAFSFELSSRFEITEFAMANSIEELQSRRG